MTTRKKRTQPEPHPLFPPHDDDDDAPEVASFHVTRFEPGRPNAVWHPHLFSANDLTDLADLHARFGGGHYELVARAANGAVTARRRYPLAGPSKPLAEEPPDESPAAPPPAPSVPQSPPLGDGMFAVLMQMMQMQQQSMLAFLERSDRSSEKFLEAMRSSTDTQMRTMSQMFESSARRADPAELFQRGIELARSTATGAPPPEPKEDEDDREMVRMALELGKDFIAHMPGQAPPPPQAAPLPRGAEPDESPDEDVTHE